MARRHPSLPRPLGRRLLAVLIAAIALLASGVLVAPSPARAAGATVPEAPTGLFAVGNNRTVTISWSPSVDGGSPVTSYEVRGDGSCTTSGEVQQCTISGLTNGVEVSLYVVAINAVGESAPSAPIKATPRTAPGAPTNVTATPGDASVTLSWSAPADDGGLPVIDYTAAATGGGGKASCRTTATTCTITKLTNGVEYRVLVQARNSFSSGSVSTAVFVTPQTSTVALPPAAPTGLTATAGVNAVTLSWTAPADNGSPITGYRVSTVGAPDNFCTTTTATTCTVAGFPNGVAQTFTVAASNANGTGASSTPATATPRGPADGPENVVIVPGDRSATVSWSAPGWNGGSPITGYDVVVEGSTLGCSTTSGDVTTCTVTGLTNGVVSTLRVYAVTDYGRGASSRPGDAGSFGPASAPQHFSAEPRNGYADFSWAAPEDVNGSSIYAYELVIDGTTACQPEGFSCTVYNLTNGRSYQAVVYALNGAGRSTASETLTVTPRTVPGAPTQLAATPGDGKVTLTWTAPASNGGAPIQGYQVLGGDGCSTTGATTCTVTGLTNGRRYSFQVLAINVAGGGARSNEVLATPGGAPGAPTGLAATAGDGQVTLSWTAPADTGGLPITGYEVTGAGSCTTTTTSCTVTGLTNGQPSSFTVRATNASGSGPASIATTATPRTVPGAPREVVSVAGASRVTVSWKAPASDGGAAVASYTVYGPDGTGCATTALSCTVTGLDDGRAYLFAVYATNAAGDGAIGIAPTAVPGTAPKVSAPAATTVVAGQTATYRVVVSGSPAPTVQWQRLARGSSTWVDVDGAVSPTLTFGPAAAGDAESQFRAVVTNALGSATSPTARLGVEAAPIVTAQPQDVVVKAGGTARFAATITAYPPPVLRWQVSADGGRTWTNTSAASSSITLKKAGLDLDRTLYRLTGTNRNGTSTTQPARLRVATLATAPTRLAVVPDDGAITATWAPPVSDGGIPVTGYTVTAKAGTQVFTCTVGAAERSCTVTGLTNGLLHGVTVRAVTAIGPGAGAVASTRPRVATVITDQPEPATARVGARYTFYSAATGTAPLQQKWEYSGDNVSWKAFKTTTPTLTGTAGRTNLFVRSVFVDVNGVRTVSRTVRLTVTP